MNPNIPGQFDGIRAAASEVVVGSERLLKGEGTPSGWSGNEAPHPRP